MKADLRINHVYLDDAITRYRHFLQRVIDGDKVVSTTGERRDIAESVLLRLCANWERFVDHHLVDCVNRDSSRLSKAFAVTIPRHPSWDLCHALIIGMGYTDFKSFADLKRYAKRLLPEGSNPFLAVGPRHAKRIDEVFCLRNYLSHYSASAKRAHMRLYSDEYKMQKFLEPGYFVLGYNARRLWSYFEAFEGASTDMKGTY